MVHLTAVLLAGIIATEAAMIATALEQFHCTWSPPLLLEQQESTDTSLTLEHYQNTARNTLTMRLTLRSNETIASYMGIGINLEGNDWLAPSVSVMGRSDSANVRWYQILNDAKDGSGVLPLFPNDSDLHNPVSFLQDATFLQDEKAGTSILNFTIPLQMNTTIDGSPPVSIVDDNNMWIYSIGKFLNNGNWVNELFGAFQMKLEDRCELQKSTSGHVSSDPTNWINATKNNDGKKGESEQDDNPPLSPSSSSPDVMGIVQSMHKWLMVAAWGVTAPLSIGVSLLKKLFPQISDEAIRSAKPIWYNCHVYLGISSILLTTLGMFVLKVIPVVGGVLDLPREKPSLRIHSLTGYAVLVVVAVYVTSSVLQFGLHYVPVPPPPPPTRIRDTETEATVDSDTDESETMVWGIEGGEQWFSPMARFFSLERAQVSLPARATVATGNDETECSDATPAVTGILVRREIQFHKFVGAVLLGSSWSACQTGYVVLAETSWVFWTCLSAISALVLTGIAIQVERDRPLGDY